MPNDYAAQTCSCACVGTQVLGFLCMYKYSADIPEAVYNVNITNQFQTTYAQGGGGGGGKIR